MPRKSSSTSAHDARQPIRAGIWDKHTSGLAPPNVQCNIVILPAGLASDFLHFCQRNPKPCPLLAVSEPGVPFLPDLGQDIDIRTDVPRYHVWRDGVMQQECTDIRALWSDDLVTFALGCSFSFEHALMETGIPLRHVEEGKNVAMFKTNMPTMPAGPFHGPMVVSMRPMSTAHAIRAVQITSRVPAVHGAPVHLGNPALIGIADIAQPDFGDAIDILPEELPVFWACGVTPQAVVMAARPPFCITHAPGHMLITDLLNKDLPFR
ncbi:putative hydro-lyase [Herbaspirillum sp. RV1423]|uniref:putative hydro-lyase n=1 Tax=Herbaspirillum sp. RV1423 TaxID=1443993 RepID=UPI000554F75A